LKDINIHLEWLTMMSFVELFMAALVLMGVAAAPTGYLHRNTIEKRQSVRPGTGTSNGFFYSFWKDNAGSVTYTNHAGGGYSVTWNNVGNFVAGKGWKIGSAR
jgi:endo-1,4-beta-xylanase